MSRKHKAFIINAILILLLLFVSGCQPARHLPDNQNLLTRNRVVIHEAEVKKEQLNSLLRQKPNRRILGLYRFHLNVYQFARQRSSTRFNNWLQNTVGEPPVVYDAVLTENTRRQLELYMVNQGYFNARVEPSVDFHRKRARVTYFVHGNSPYSVRDMKYQITDAHLASFILPDTLNSLINRGDRYNAELMQKERERITRNLKNAGFFAFSREFIVFEVDSNLSSHQVDLTMVVLNPGQGARDSLPGRRHQRYLLDQVFIYPEHSPFRAEVAFPDTTVFRFRGRNKEREYIFLHNEPLRIRQKALVQNIMLDQGSFYRIGDVEQTYNYLSGLRNFRFINVQFSKEHEPLSGTPSDTLAFLNASVQLSRSAANAFTIEAEGINSSGNLGVAGNFVFQNRNLFQGAEILNFRLKGAMEVTGETSGQDNLQKFPFNTLELGAEVSIDFPKLLFPIPMERIARTARPKSTVLSGINYRQRPDYTRYIFNISYGFEWSETQKKRHYLHPLEISSIKIFNDSILQSKIPDANPLILSRYRDHLIAGSKYTYIYNTQNPALNSNFTYFRLNLESAGNLLELATRAFDSSSDQNGSTTIFNIPFAQYVKADADFRYYWMLEANTSLVLRAMAGIGLPYGNTNVLPFIKSYYAGGANGLRAWRIYSVGPGGHQDTLGLRFDKYGDIKLEANLEYRFPIYSFWHGALFVDAGNVWFIEENPQFTNGSFSPKRFYREIAIGTGFGLRMDFEYFVVRVDMGIPVRDPGHYQRNRWAGGIPSLSEFNFNLGIGYPF